MLYNFFLCFTAARYCWNRELLCLQHPGPNRYMGKTVLLLYSHSEVKCDMGIERGEIGLCIPRKIWVTVSKFEEFYVQKFDRCRVKHLSDRVELSTRE